MDTQLYKKNDAKEDILLPKKYCDFVDLYEYRIFYSREDQAYISNIAEMSDISASGDTKEEALEEIRVAVTGTLEYLYKEGKEGNIPEPLSLRRYSGKFITRISPEVHSRLVKEAMNQSLSLNALVSNILSGYIHNKNY